MVDRRHTSGDISTRLNNQRYGGRVPPQRKSLECHHDSWFCRSWYYGRTGALDVHKSSSLRQEGVKR